MKVRIRAISLESPNCSSKMPQAENKETSCSPWPGIQAQSTSSSLFTNFRLASEDISGLQSTITQHKKQAHQIAAPTKILGKRLYSHFLFSWLLYRKGLPFEGEAKRRLRLQEIKDFEGGRKCLSPSIFRKTKGSNFFATQGNSYFALGGLQDSTQRGREGGGKRGETNGNLREFNIAELDLN